MTVVSVNRTWWEHLAPKPMHRRLREIEALLRDWCRSEYGAFWLGQAVQKGGRIRVRPGQVIPVVHVIALKDRPAFIAPIEFVRQDHRSVGEHTMESGRPLGDGEMA